MRGVSSGDGRDAALSRQQPIRPAGTHRPRPSGMLPYIARGVAASAVAGRAAACLAAAAATILIGASAAPASAPAGGWSITPSPNSRVPTGQLFWVSCPTAHSCMAVGTYVKASGIGVNLAEQWKSTFMAHPAHSQPPRHGGQRPARRRLRIILGLHGGRGQHHHRGCSPNSGRTVGRHEVDCADSTPHSPPGGFLNAVSCTSASAAPPSEALPQGPSPNGGNGTRWTIQPTPNPSQGGGGLSGVSCTSAAACTAVGGSSAGALAERWNGTRWSIQSTPNPAQGGGFLTSVACTSASACTAVGVSNARTLAERWNGTTWTIKRTPTCGSPVRLPEHRGLRLTVGVHRRRALRQQLGVFRTLAEHWNGTAWHRQATRNRGTKLPDRPGRHLGRRLYRRRVLQHQPVPGGPGRAVGGRLLAHPGRTEPARGGVKLFFSVACASASACTAVGATTTRTRTMATLAERWNGHTCAFSPPPARREEAP